MNALIVDRLIDRLRMIAICLYWLLLAGLMMVNGLHANATDLIPIALNWNVEPKLDVNWRTEVEAGKLDLDVRHFDSPMADVRLNAAQKLLRSLQHPSLDKKVLSDAIARRLEKGETQRAVQKALVSSLCEVDDGSQASLLWRIASTEPELSSIVERSLVRWKSPLGLELWRSRVGADHSNDQNVLLSCRGLAVVGTQDDLLRLVKEVESPLRNDAIRFEAALAISALSQSDLLPLAQRVREQNSSTSNLLAALLLRTQPMDRNGPSVQAFYDHLLESGDGPAQRVAYEWHCEYSPDRAHAIAFEMLSKHDTGIRRQAVALMRTKHDEQSFRTLIEALNDTNSDIRQMARENIVFFANQSESNERKVIEMIDVVLGRKNWQAKEQCIRLAVEFKQSQYAPRIVELLDHPESDLTIVAAWGLKHLADDENVLSEMLRHAEKWAETFNEPHAIRVAHLLEAFGIHRFPPAQALLLRCVPRTDKFHRVNRISGTWATGKMWESQSNPGLLSQLHARISDKNNLSPESESIRFAATLSLGFVADPSSRPILDAMNEPDQPIGFATEWAIRRIDARRHANP